MNKISSILIIYLILNISCSDEVSYLVKGVSEPVISLNGKWNIITSGYENAMQLPQGELKWIQIDVPGEAMMQGIPIRHDQPFLYSKEITIPEEFREKIIKIRFEGVYSYARVWINENFVREHYGGFTAWECDITPYVKPGEKTLIYVEVTDRADEISYASGYAKHQAGGILRNVSLMAYPVNYPEAVIITTDFDNRYKDAILTVKGLTIKEAENSEIDIELFDENNSRVKLQTSTANITGKNFEIKNSVISPSKWDPEHPNLYCLRVRFSENGQEYWRKDYFFGFREVSVEGNRFLVNGKQVKLRGACRHDFHPLLGRLSTPEYDLRDVLLAKEANMNFIRTSHYPPSEKFLDYCDKYGIFVEDETAVCFVGSHRTAEYYPGSSENSSEFTERYISQLKEMVDNHRNHPSVILWSIGNENTFGSNFKKSYDWVKANDPTRPVIFSYPGQVPDSVRAYDLISMHYPGTDGNMDQYGLRIKSFSSENMPVLFDEWAHVACYNQETVKEDPNVRDFWGMSLDTMWQKVFEADGGLGGAIWGMIDETFMLPEDLPGYNDWWGKIDKNVIPASFTGHTIGYGEWGFIDTWRRKKPEFWSVKKAYSPIRILQTQGYDLTGKTTLNIPVYNRFDFTNLEEIRLKVTSGAKQFEVALPDLEPHAKGIITLNGITHSENNNLILEFYDNEDNLIDYYELSGINDPAASSSDTDSGNAVLISRDNEYLIESNNHVFHIDRKTGLFTSFENRTGKARFNGPYISFRVLGEQVNYSSYSIADICSDWQLRSLKAEQSDRSVSVSINGEYKGNIRANFNIVISADGDIHTDYKAEGLPGSYVREAGIRFIFDDVFDTLSWRRNTYWPGYPPDHLSASQGMVPLYTEINKKYRHDPDKEWIYDKKSFFYNGTDDENNGQLINIARSTKENILEYKLKIKSGGDAVVHGEGDKSCRIVKGNDHIQLLVNDIVDYPDINWGNYSRRIVFIGPFTGSANISFSDGRK